MTETVCAVAVWHERGASRRLHTRKPAKLQLDMRFAVRLAVFTGGTLAGLLLVYWQVGGYDFDGIDTPMYVLHPRIVGPATLDNVWWLLTHPIAFNWTPLSWYSHMVDHQLFGQDAGAHHWMNVIYHALAATAVFAFLSRATSQSARSAAAALLFAFHPLRVESVAWVVERKDTLSGLFGALAMWAYAEHARRPRVSSYAAAWLLYVCAILAKSMLVVLPCLMLLVDYWPLARQRPSAPETRPVPLQRLLIEKLPFLPPALVAAYMARYGVGYTSASHDPLSLSARLLNAVFSLAQYIRKTVVPSDLSFWYPHPYLPPTGGRGLDALTIVLSLCLLASLGLLCVLQLRKRPYLFVGYVWFGVGLLPVLGVYFQAGRQGMADRFTYFPSIGLCLMAVWSAADWFASRRWRPVRAPWFAAVVVGAVVLVLGWRSHVETSRWKSTETIYTDVLLKNPRNTHIHYLLGRMLIERGETERGLSHLIRAATLTPSWDDLVTGLANELRNAGRLDEAIVWYRRAHEAWPQYNHTAINLAAALAAAGRYAEAIPLLEQAREANPKSVPTRINLAAALAAAGRLTEASAELDRALALEPASVHSLWLSARVHLALNDRIGAVERLKRVLRASPDDTQARELLAQLGHP